MPGALIEIERFYEAPAALVWALLSDTNRFDRAMGFTLPVYAWRDIDGRREHVGRAKQNGLTVEWIEPPYQWIEGRMLLSHRAFILGPIRQDLDPDEPVEAVEAPDETHDEARRRRGHEPQPGSPRSEGELRGPIGPRFRRSRASPSCPRGRP